MFRFFSSKYSNNIVWLCGATLIVILSVPYGTVSGATEDFITTAFIGSDSTPPSIPGSVTATPVATSQIDLSWSSSTDNYLLSGYHVWRDDIRIATTTSTTYSDTGLTASTTYMYYITAFDPFFNESASSSIVSTTTLDTPPPTPTTTATSSSQTGNRLQPLENVIQTIQIVPQKDSVTITYTTEIHVRSVIRWGRTTSYELGSLTEHALSRTHETNIAGLTPGTVYWFTIEGENSIGRHGTMYTGLFMTLPPEDIFPPGNVSNLTAMRNGNDVLLSWKNPEDPDLVKVRILRNSNFYPSDTADGWVIYEGLGTFVRDVNILETETTQYYTAFTYDAMGNVSSGAVVSISSDGVVMLPDPDPEKNGIMLTHRDIEFYQEGVHVPWEGEVVSIDGAKQFTISMPYNRFPEHLKTILVTITEGTERQTFTFLLRANKEKTVYTGTVAPLGVAGTFPITVTVFDFKTSQIGYTHGIIVAHIDPIHSGVGRFFIAKEFVYLMWFMVLGTLLFLIRRRLIHVQQ